MSATSFAALPTTSAARSTEHNSPWMQKLQTKWYRSKSRGLEQATQVNIIAYSKGEASVRFCGIRLALVLEQPKTGSVPSTRSPMYRRRPSSKQQHYSLRQGDIFPLRLLTWQNASSLLESADCRALAGKPDTMDLLMERGRHTEMVADSLLFLVQCERTTSEDGLTPIFFI
ncbi:hypothetical protein cyc_08160 [Cyclospora cayetanensis]|uniref:Uncharacterized protein n=1 Tax=Cyclospora cayetanensis TaxID=88456 RepID=A0A1D3D7T0_9EIME|nr:hypothetical protein cyc_08160 [Cyclospora cayetanensis]